MCSQLRAVSRRVGRARPRPQPLSPPPARQTGAHCPPPSRSPTRPRALTWEVRSRASIAGKRAPSSRASPRSATAHTQSQGDRAPAGARSRRGAAIETRRWFEEGAANAKELGTSRRASGARWAPLGRIAVCRATGTCSPAAYAASHCRLSGCRTSWSASGRAVQRGGVGACDRSARLPRRARLMERGERHRRPGPGCGGGACGGQGG